MTWTTLHDSLLLTREWQMASVSPSELYRISFVSGGAGIVGVGKYEVGQFDADGSAFGLRGYRIEPAPLCIAFPKPRFFQSQRLGFRLPTGTNPFSIKIEVNDMPFYNAGNPSGASVSVTSTVQASTTAVVISPANPDRKMYAITNNSAKSLFLDFDSEVTLTAYAYEVKAGVVYEMPVPFLGDVRGIWAAGATGSCKVVEFF
jgi:hypothetical protein